MSNDIDTTLQRNAKNYLDFFCLDLSTRRTGSAHNRRATDYFYSTIKRFGFEVEKSRFDCLDWNADVVSLSVDGEPVEAQVSPYSNGIEVEAPLIHISTLEELQASEAEGKIVLMTGDLVKEQLMPKNFPFYNPEHHQEIIATLEQKQPAALITATGADPQMAGGSYPFPLFEDGDFELPSVFIKDVQGARLSAFEGKSARLRIEAQREPSYGFNVIARKGQLSGPRLVFCAHIDAKEGTPGALDNAAGVVTLLLIAELLKDYSGAIPVEISAINGEDYYAASGEIEYLRSSLGAAEDILLAINIDGAGYIDGSTSYSFYGVSDHLTQAIRSLFSTYPDLSEGKQWYQSDHSIFVQQDIPAMAFCSDQFDLLWSEIAHTPADRPEIVSIHKLVNLSRALSDLLLLFDREIYTHSS
jgi:aminopeptidase YwaD